MNTDVTTLSAEALERRIADAAQILMDRLIARNEMIATAESCTAGLIAAAITEIPGSSAVFERGWATYSNEAKAEELKIEAALIQHYGAVSAQVAEAMALGAVACSRADFAVSVTGVAGPGASEAKPVGLVYFGAARQTSAKTLERRFGERSRAEIRRLSVLTALEFAHETLG
ncbi:MAG: CinA family protein [Neomegalonema sp.]|nr:CinA family protein [Neomegalonema sp.]